MHLNTYVSSLLFVRCLQAYQYMFFNVRKLYAQLKFYRDCIAAKAQANPGVEELWVGPSTVSRPVSTASENAKYLGFLS